MIIERTEFEKDGKKFPMLSMRRKQEDRYPFTFGVGKARMIVEALEEIKQFIVDNES